MTSSSQTRNNSPSALLTRSFRKQFPQAARAEGVYVWDSEGKRYLDFSGSAAVNFIGHGVREVGDAMAQQAARLEFVHSSQFITQEAEEFAQQVLNFAGENFRGGCVYFTSGGSEAVETALKLARQYQIEVGQTQRYQIISRKQSYHGATLGALAVSGNAKRREIYLPMVRECEHVSAPYCYRCQHGCNGCAQKYADDLDYALQKIGVEAAAFILELVSGATLGAAVPPSGYLQRVAEICQRHHLLLIADEVMTGFGRTGKNFAIDHWGIAPDIIVAAKGIASGYAPLGAVIANQRVRDALANGSGAFIHGFTYNAHPVSIAAGRAVMSRMQSQRLITAANSDTGSIGCELRQQLLPWLDLPQVGDVRGIGLLWGVEFVRDKKTKQPFAADVHFSDQVARAAAQRGILVYPMQGCIDGYEGDHVLIAPPAVITPQEIRWAVEQLRSAIAAVRES